MISYKHFLNNLKLTANISLGIPHREPLRYKQMEERRNKKKECHYAIQVHAASQLSYLIKLRDIIKHTHTNIYLYICSCNFP